MSYAPQSSPALLRLPACLLLVWAGVAAPLAAQDEQSLAEPANLHREPEGAPLVSLPAGAPVELGESKDGWREVTVEGWISTPSISPTKRDGFDLVVTPDGGENLRRSPNGPLIGRAREGTLLERLGQRGKWTRVRREGWVPGQAVPARSRAQGRAPANPAPPPPAAAKPLPAPAPETALTLRETNFSPTPEGAAIGTLHAGTPAKVTARAGEWVRLQIDAWVRDTNLRSSEGGALAGITAAEVRASPDRYVGRTLDWRLQLISVQTADELRTELPPGQPYLLTRGPLPEPGFVYVSIPQDRVEEFRSLPPLSELVLRLNLRAARTRYLETPVTELVSVIDGMQRK